MSRIILAITLSSAIATPAFAQLPTRIVPNYGGGYTIQHSNPTEFPTQVRPDGMGGSSRTSSAISRPILILTAVRAVTRSMRRFITRLCRMQNWMITMSVEHWSEHSWVTDVATQARDGRPMFWDEGHPIIADCAKCRDSYPVVPVIFHEQQRLLCKPCTYLIAGHPEEWPA